MRLNIAVVSLTEPFDTSTSAGRLMLNMLASFADFEHDVIVERSVSGTNARARTGPGSYLPMLDKESSMNQVGRASQVRSGVTDFTIQ
jgi:DNA invertase Pin-like site-specific DNA recombinase